MHSDEGSRRHLNVISDAPASTSVDLVLDDEGRAPPAGDVDPEALRARAVGALRSVYDPEIPVNIYDLGLVYRLAVDDAGVVEVDMTLTSPACPIAGHLLREVHDALRHLAEVSRVRTRLVWDPPWTPDRMSEAVRLELGLL
jgi:FeS assembly SUF system protein